MWELEGGPEKSLTKRPSNMSTLVNQYCRILEGHSKANG